MSYDNLCCGVFSGCRSRLLVRDYREVLSGEEERDLEGVEP